jgi:hypothetical protein
MTPGLCREPLKPRLKRQNDIHSAPIVAGAVNLHVNMYSKRETDGAINYPVLGEASFVVAHRAVRNCTAWVTVGLGAVSITHDWLLACQISSKLDSLDALSLNALVRFHEVCTV